VVSEKPTRLQWAGIALSIIARVVYFYPPHFRSADLGMLVALICISAIFWRPSWGRQVNSSRLYPPLQLTLVSMGAGSMILLARVWPRRGYFDQREELDLLVWLAAVNTAFAFTL